MGWMGYVRLGGAVVTGAITQFLGGWDIALQALVILMVIDVISGLLASVIVKRPLSSIFARHGILRKILSLFVVVLAVALDRYAGTEALRGIAIGFYIMVEGLSILENMSKAGVLVPHALAAIFKETKKWKQE